MQRAWGILAGFAGGCAGAAVALETVVSMRCLLCQVQQGAMMGVAVGALFLWVNGPICRSVWGRRFWMLWIAVSVGVGWVCASRQLFWEYGVDPSVRAMAVCPPSFGILWRSQSFGTLLREMWDAGCMHGLRVCGVPLALWSWVAFCIAGLLYLRAARRY